MFHGWDPGTDGEIGICREIFLPFAIGRVWNQDGFVVIRILGVMEVQLGNDFGSVEIWNWETQSWKIRGTALVIITTRTFLLLAGRGHRGTRRERSPREEPKEEGEIQDTGSTNRGVTREGNTSASNNLQVSQQEERRGYGNVVKVISKPVGVVNGEITAMVSENIGTGLELAQKQIGVGNDRLVNEGMDLEEIGNHIDGEVGLMCDDDGFQNLTDGEMEELTGAQEVALVEVAEDSHAKEVGEKGPQAGEDEKKKGTRKLLLKQTVMAAGTSKKKFVQALLSQNKSVQSRQGKRQGEGIRSQEEKGPLQPKPTSSKPSNAPHG
ncbi:hypothetical protein HID58_014048 [Brassica napus]|uniref:Uncharacterized protein n=1 Tax=Brassica napus TaxID=3708 RepID=A0ABQ8DFZ8_BRANA|nr:hypothetical protein HID58_014048 [Brassica napus]